MFLIYEPENGPAERYDLDDLAAIESEMVEQQTRLKWPAVLAELRDQGPTAMRAVLWTQHKRKTPTLRYADFDVPRWQRTLRVRLNREELAELHAAVVRGIPADDQEQAMAELRDLADDPADVDALIAGVGPAAPKATADRWVEPKIGASPS